MYCDSSFPYPYQSGSGVKTDKKDSLKLARLLESSMLKKSNMIEFKILKL